MTKTKEKIKTIVHKADGSVEHTTEKMGTVYKKKDGREWAHCGQRYLLVQREAELAVVHQHPETAPTATPPPALAPTESATPIATVATDAATAP
jgi:hypothetical protein